MMRRLAVTMRIVQTLEYAEPRDAISHDWIRWLTALGIIPVFVPNVLSEPVTFLKETGCDALLLTNGEDILSDLPDGLTAVEKPAEWAFRDSTEQQLLTYAIRYQLPVLGVCRGFQLINAYFGGSLYHHLQDNPAINEGHVATQHNVELINQFKEIFGADPTQVNSYHRHGITLDRIAHDLAPCALASGGVVEAFRHRTFPIWGIQWHPERPRFLF